MFSFSNMAEIVKRNRSDGVFHKHKRARYEAAKQAVGSYLSRRHYSEIEIQKKNISCDQLLISQLVEKETARPNSILYSNSNYRNTFNNDPNPIQVEPYFCKFISFINRLPESIKLDLSKFICPLFCHLYLDLLQSAHQQSASLLLKFYQEQKGITESDFCSQVIKEFTNQEIKTKPIIKTFRSSKHKLKISPEAISILKKFLSKNGHVLILQAFQTWFDIEITSPVKLESDEEDCDSMSCNGETFDQEIDTDIQELQDAILSVNQQPPPVLLVNVFNSQENATCGLVHGVEEKAVVGFNTSDIYMWSIGSSILPCSGVIGNAAKISLACDNIPDNAINPYEERPLTSTGAVVLRGHGDSVQDVRILSEANVLLSVSQDRTMRAWRLSDYSCAAIYRGHNYPIWCLDVSTYGLYIATGSYDRTVRLWSLDRIYPHRILAGHTKDVNSVHFHPNGSYFATGSADTTVRMWSVTDPKTVRLLVGHKGVVSSVAFSPDGQYLASAGYDKTIRIWDLAAAKQISELSGCLNVVTGLSWSNNGKSLAAISLDGCVRVWDADSAIKKTANDSSNLDISSVYNTGCTSLLSVKYDKNWLTCLSASAVI